MNLQLQEPDTGLTETDAIESAKNGDVAGYEYLYHQYKRQIYSLCLRLCGNTFDAEDLTQEVFLQVYRKISTFRGDAKFGSWLYRVAVNFAFMHARKHRVDQVSCADLSESKQERLGSHLSNGPGNVSFAVERVALGRALSCLPRGRWKVVLLHDIKGYSHGEVAECLGMAVSTSKSQLYRAHMALRQLLDGSRQVADPAERADQNV